MAQGSLKAWALAAMLAIAACSTPAAKPAPPAPAPAPAPAPPAPQAAQAAPPADSCGAAALQTLVGKPHTDIPVPVDPSRRRVICSTCVKTEDFVPTRQTITYDTDTGLVTSVTCG